MANYEVTSARIPANRQELEQFERHLEQISRRGAELVTTMSSPNANFAILIFRVPAKGTVPKEDME